MKSFYIVIWNYDSFLSAWYFIKIFLEQPSLPYIHYTADVNSTVICTFFSVNPYTAQVNIVMLLICIGRLSLLSKPYLLTLLHTGQQKFQLNFKPDEVTLPRNFSSRSPDIRFWITVKKQFQVWQHCHIIKFTWDFKHSFHFNFTIF